MCLVARELERRGIATVCVLMLEEVARKARPPRALLVPFGWGQPLGPPGEAATHEAAARAALGLLTEDAREPVVRRWEV